MNKRTTLAAIQFTMWRPFLLSALSLSAFGNLHAQKLDTSNWVPNGSFEVLNKEPKTFDQLDLATEWGNVTIGYPELFSPEAKEKTVGIPDNFYGKMKPFDGEHYAGFFAWKDDKRRNYEGDAQDPFEPGWSAYSEYPEIELKKPLEAGHTYEVSFEVALAQNSDRAVAGLGALCFPFKLQYQNRMFMKERPQVVEVKILADRGKWTEVKGTFVADGGERYLVIGTFPTAIFETKRIIEGPDNQFAYYYLDHVVLKEVEKAPAGDKGD